MSGVMVPDCMLNGHPPCGGLIQLQVKWTQALGQIEKQKKIIAILNDAMKEIVRNWTKVGLTPEQRNEAMSVIGTIALREVNEVLECPSSS